MKNVSADEENLAIARTLMDEIEKLINFMEDESLGYTNGIWLDDCFEIANRMFRKNQISKNGLRTMKKTLKELKEAKKHMLLCWAEDLISDINSFIIYGKDDEIEELDKMVNLEEFRIMESRIEQQHKLRKHDLKKLENILEASKKIEV